MIVHGLEKSLVSKRVAHGSKEPFPNAQFNLLNWAFFYLKIDNFGLSLFQTLCSLKQVEKVYACIFD